MEIASFPTQKVLHPDNFFNISFKQEMCKSFFLQKLQIKIVLKTRTRRFNTERPYHNKLSPGCNAKMNPEYSKKLSIFCKKMLVLALSFFNNLLFLILNFINWIQLKQKI